MGNLETIQTVIPKKKKKQFLKILSHFQDPAILFNEKENFLQINQLAVEFFGAKKMSEIKKIGLAGLFPLVQPHLKVTTRDAITASIKKTINKQEKEINFECECQKTNGDLFWGYIWITPINLADTFAIQMIFKLKTETTEIKEAPRIVVSDIESEKGDEKSKTQTDTEDQKNPLEELSSQESDLSDFYDKYENTNVNRKNTVIPITNFDLETDSQDKLKKLVETVKFQVREAENPTVELDVIQNLNRIYQLFLSAINERDQNIQKIMEKLKSERKNFEKKYDELEEHLQRRLAGIQTEKQVKMSVSDTNLKMKKGLELIAQNIISQKQNQKKLLEQIQSLEGELTTLSDK